MPQYACTPQSNHALGLTLCASAAAVACSQPALLAARQPLQDGPQRRCHVRRAEHLPGALGLGLSEGRPLCGVVTPQIALGGLRTGVGRGGAQEDGRRGAQTRAATWALASLSGVPLLSAAVPGSVPTWRPPSGAASICPIASSAAACRQGRALAGRCCERLLLAAAAVVGTASADWNAASSQRSQPARTARPGAPAGRPWAPRRRSAPPPWPPASGGAGRHWGTARAQLSAGTHRIALQAPPAQRLPTHLWRQHHRKLQQLLCGPAANNAPHEAWQAGRAGWGEGAQFVSLASKQWRPTATGPSCTAAAQRRRSQAGSITRALTCPHLGH